MTMKGEASRAAAALSGVAGQLTVKCPKTQQLLAKLASPNRINRSFCKPSVKVQTQRMSERLNAPVRSGHLLTPWALSQMHLPARQTAKQA